MPRCCGGFPIKSKMRFWQLRKVLYWAGFPDLHTTICWSLCWSLVYGFHGIWISRGLFPLIPHWISPVGLLNEFEQALLLYSFKQGRLLEEGSEQARKTSIPAWSQAAYQSEGNLFGEARSTYIEYWLSRNDVYTECPKQEQGIPARFKASQTHR